MGIIGYKYDKSIPMQPITVCIQRLTANYSIRCPYQV